MLGHMTVVNPGGSIMGRSAFGMFGSCFCVSTYSDFMRRSKNVQGLRGICSAPLQWHRATLCTTDLHCAGDLSVFRRRCRAWTKSIVIPNTVVHNIHANQGSQCSSVPVHTLMVHNAALFWLGGAEDNFSCTSWATSQMAHGAKLSV